MKTTSLVLVLAFVLVGCSGDTEPTTAGDTTAQTTTSSAPSATADATLPPELTLTAAEQEWCSFTGDDVDADALRFNDIFEEGLYLGLQMDLVNAQASGFRDEHVAAGMTEQEAIQATSIDLQGLEDFVLACKAAFALAAG